MKGNTPKEITLRTSLIISILTASIYAVFSFILSKNLNWIVIVTLLLFIFTVSYYFIYQATHTFLYKKVKLIYKTIHNFKTQKDNKLKIDMNRDVLNDVNNEVENWAESKIKEIKQLQEKDDFRKEFVGNVAHELKTPVFSIQGYLLTLLEGALDDPNINREFLMRAAKATDRMTRIIEDLDAITQFETGNLNIKVEKFNLIESVKEVFHELEIEARKQSIVLKFNKEYDKPIQVLGDKFRIHQVLINLISNSINYGKEGGKTSVRFFDMDENYLVEVSDNGPGISEEHLPRLFERFYRVDKSRARHIAGTGLGLAIVKHIIEAHEQGINVRSTVGIGSTFSFTMQKAK
jgi:two-component system, OmpR family, phosphate regulon sensor histidine kinase PhoR